MTKKMIWIITLVGLLLNVLINVLHLVFFYETTLIEMRIVLIVCTLIAGIFIMLEMFKSFEDSKYSLMLAIFAIAFACGAGGIMYILWFKNIGRLSAKDKAKKKYNK